MGNLSEFNGDAVAVAEKEGATLKERAVLFSKFLCSLPLIWIAYISFQNFFSGKAEDPVWSMVGAPLIFLWGSSWFLQLFGLNNSKVFKRISNNSIFKKIIKAIGWSIIVILAIAILLGAFSLASSLSATTVIIILLVLILLK